MQKNLNKGNTYLEKEPIKKLLLKYSLPCVTSMLVGALYNIVDQIFIGQGVGYLGNAATTVVFPFTVLALALALMIGDGSAALLSLSLGKKDEDSTHRSIGNSMVLIGIITIILVFLGFVFGDNLLKFFGVTEACYDYAKDYLNVILIGFPFYMITSALNGAIRADGSPKYAMFGAIINLILDPIAIFVLDMGVKGAALATVIGQLATCIATIMYFKNTKTFKLTKESFKLKLSIVKTISKLGISSFIIQIAIVIVIAVANNMIVIYGPESIYGADIPLSAIGIVMKVFAIVIAFAVGVSVGGQPIIGYNFGAKNYKRVFQTYKCILLTNIVIGGISTLLFLVFPQSIVNLFGHESELYNQYARMCFRIYLGGTMITCIQKASSIFLQSIGNSLKATILSLSRDILFFVPALLILASKIGVVGMLWAAPISDIFSLLAAIILVSMEFRKINRLEKEESQVEKCIKFNVQGV